MTSFVPKSKAYDIYYPKSFSVNEDDEGIATFSDSASKLNITLSSYEIEKDTNDQKLIEQLSGFLKDYFGKEIPLESWNSYKTKFDVLVEVKTSKENINWVWWGVVSKNRLVLISVNKEELVSEDDMKLLQFMINNMIINS